MSDVKRYRFKGAAGEYVYSVDYDKAQSQLAALREELGECKGEYDRAVNNVAALREELATEKARSDAAVGDANEAEQRLADAERRNKVYESLLRRSSKLCRLSSSFSTADDIDNALNQNPEAASHE